MHSEDPMPKAIRRAGRPKAFLAPLLLILVHTGCVSLTLTESTRPFPGHRWPNAPTIAVAEARDRRPDPGVLGRVGWNSLKMTGDAGTKFRNALMTSINEHAYNVRFVGNVNVLDPSAVAAAVREAKSDFLLTAAVLDIRAFSVDPFFDPADVDFTAQVNLLDPDGRTRYTRHIHVHEDKRLWFNPAFGARDMLDAEMDRVANFVATDSELVRVLSEPRGRPAAPAVPAEGPATTVPLSGIPESPPEATPPPEVTAPPVEETPPAEATPPGETTPAESAPAPEEPATPEESPPSPEAGPPADATAPDAATPPGDSPAPTTSAPAQEEPPPDETVAPDEEIVPPPAGRDPVFVEPGAAP